MSSVTLVELLHRVALVHEIVSHVLRPEQRLFKLKLRRKNAAPWPSPPRATGKSPSYCNAWLLCAWGPVTVCPRICPLAVAVTYSCRLSLLQGLTRQRRFFLRVRGTENFGPQRPCNVTSPLDVVVRLSK